MLSLVFVTMLVVLVVVVVLIAVVAVVRAGVVGVTPESVAEQAALSQTGRPPAPLNGGGISR